MEMKNCYEAGAPGIAENFERLARVVVLRRPHSAGRRVAPPADAQLNLFPNISTIPEVF